MFVLRLIFDGKKTLSEKSYYHSFDAIQMMPKFTDTVGLAQQVSADDAVGIISAMIDGPRIVAVPECLKDTTEAECRDFSSKLANGFFQNPSKEMSDFIFEKAIRRDSEEPISYKSEHLIPEHSDCYMSIWEWIARATVK